MPEETGVVVVGDVKCYHCGHVSGQLEGERTIPLPQRRFRPRRGYTKPPPEPGARIRCERCNGPVYLDDVRPLEPPLGLAAMPLPLPRSTRRPRRAA